MRRKIIPSIRFALLSSLTVASFCGSASASSSFKYPACAMNQLTVEACVLNSDQQAFIHELEFGGRQDVPFLGINAPERTPASGAVAPPDASMSWLDSGFEDVARWRIPAAGYYKNIDLRLKFSSMLTPAEIRKDVSLWGMTGAFDASGAAKPCQWSALNKVVANAEQCVLQKGSFSQPALSASLMNKNSLYPNNLTFWMESSARIPLERRGLSGSSVQCPSTAQNPVDFRALTPDGYQPPPGCLLRLISPDRPLTFQSDCSVTGATPRVDLSCSSASTPPRDYSYCWDKTEFSSCAWITEMHKSPVLKHGFYYHTSGSAPPLRPHFGIRSNASRSYSTTTSSFPFMPLVRFYPVTAGYRVLAKQRAEELPLIRYNHTDLFGQTLLLKPGSTVTLTPEILNSAQRGNLLDCTVYHFRGTGSNGMSVTSSLRATAGEVSLQEIGEGASYGSGSAVQITPVTSPTNSKLSVLVDKSCKLTLTLAPNAKPGALLPLSVVPTGALRDGSSADGAPFDLMIQADSTSTPGVIASDLEMATPYLYSQPLARNLCKIDLGANASTSASIAPGKSGCFLDLTDPNSSATQSAISFLNANQTASFFAQSELNQCTTDTSKRVPAGVTCLAQPGQTVTTEPYNGRGTECQVGVVVRNSPVPLNNCWLKNGEYEKGTDTACPVPSSNGNYANVNYQNPTIFSIDNQEFPRIPPGVNKVPTTSLEFGYGSALNGCTINAEDAKGRYLMATPMGSRFKPCEEGKQPKNCWMFARRADLSTVQTEAINQFGQTFLFPGSRLSIPGFGAVVTKDKIRKGVSIFGVEGDAKGAASEFGSGIYRMITSGTVDSSRLTYSDETKVLGRLPYSPKHLAVPPVYGVESVVTSSSRRVNRANWNSNVHVCNDLKACRGAFQGIATASNLEACDEGICWNGEKKGAAGEGKWQLQKRICTPQRCHEVWKDLSSLLSWSTLVGQEGSSPKRFNWCQASGANVSENPQVPLRTKSDSNTVCANGEYQNKYSDQQVLSACYGSPTEGFDTTQGIKVASLGDLYYWRLPTIFDYMLAVHNGLPMVFPDVSENEWTATVSAKNTSRAFAFSGINRTRSVFPQTTTFSARCVGRAQKDLGQ
ncbi:MAG: hypothetical protein KGQ59_04610 [Bdellovibrionales bacterium]|nr:hypothetical protein [Bdellovibrionales bacterium]